MNKIEVKENVKIENLIYEIRGTQVMLDSDLAKLYGCKNGTKDINKAVNRNLDRFPNDFYFQLTKIEQQNLWFQVGTANKMIRTEQHVFTESGVAMLASILKTDVASKVSVNIMRAFVNMKRYISTNLIEQKYINELVLKDNERINLLEKTFDKLQSNEKINTIFFEGQIYDAYSLMMKILSKAKKEIIIIDNYAGRELFDLIKDVKVKVVVYTKNIDSEAIKKYKKQYNNIEIITNNSFHDRFIILDKKELYHCGASFKDLGTKCFAINKIENKEILNNLLNYIN